MRRKCRYEQWHLSVHVRGVRADDLSGHRCQVFGNHLLVVSVVGEERLFLYQFHLWSRCSRWSVPNVANYFYSFTCRRETETVFGCGYCNQNDQASLGRKEWIDERMDGWMEYQGWRLFSLCWLSFRWDLRRTTGSTVSCCWILTEEPAEKQERQWYNIRNKKRT